MSIQEAEKHFAISRESDGRWVRVDLNLPDSGNAMTRERTLALIGLLNTLSADESAHLVSIEARGEYFCRGRDPKGDDRSGMSAYEVRERVLSVILDAYAAITSCAIPVVARVQGRAAGFGAALSMACDMTLASDAAKFSFPEINNAVPPALAMTTLLNKVPSKAISYLIYTAKEIDAREALTFGMVSKVFATQSFAADTEVLLKEIAARPRVVLKTIKRFERNASQMTADMSSEYAGTLLALAQTEIKKS